MRNTLRILIVGGYGTFGGRIVELLENTPRLTLIVAGRDVRKAEAFCAARRPATADLVPAAFDRDGDVPQRLSELRPDLLIDASGPFQGYGETRYRIVKACLAGGIDYLDLADGSDFVAGIAAFDEVAQRTDRFVLSGVSSFPMLTAAVIRRLSSGMARVDVIRGGIAPSPYAGVGENVIRAIASYAGQPVAVRQEGQAATAFPFTEHRRFTIAPPGRVPLERRLFSLVDVPDLRVMTELWPDAQTVWMGAAPVPEILHRALILLARLVRIGLIPTVLPLARLMHFSTNHLRWGEHRGGMFVAVEGVDGDGAPVSRSWHLLAEGDDGPLIPSMAVEAIVRQMLDGRPPLSGARAAVGDVNLDDFERLFAGRTIETGVRDERLDKGLSLYARVLGPAWDALPQEIRRMHDGTVVAEGRASVERGRNPLARLAAAIVGFPEAAADTPVRVRFDASEGAETWTRTFGDKRFSSRQFAGEGAWSRLLCERFGPLTFGIALVTDGERLSLVLRRWSAFGVPMPMWLCPLSKTFETRGDGRFRFHVELGHPLLGLVVRYRGWLIPVLKTET